MDVTKSIILNLNLLWLTSLKLFSSLPIKFDRHSNIKLTHHHFGHTGALLELIFEQNVDLIILENEYLNHKVQEVLQILPYHQGIKVLIAEDSKNIFFAFKMNIDRCYSKDLNPKEISLLIQDGIEQKKMVNRSFEPYEQNLILSNNKKERFRVIHWNDLISFQKRKEQTMIHQTQDISFLQNTPYEEIQKKNLSPIIFQELRPGFTINVNHLHSIEYVQSNYYHCNMSDGRVIEINGGDRTRLLRFLEKGL